MDYGFDVPLEYKNKKWWDVIECPHEISNQHFGFEVFIEKPVKLFEPVALKCGIEDKTGYSKVINDGQQFKIELTLGQFTKEDVSVSTLDNCVIIRLLHGSKREGLATISRKFERTYFLPDECDLKNIKGSVVADKVIVVCKKIFTLTDRETPVHL